MTDKEAMDEIQDAFDKFRTWQRIGDADQKAASIMDLRLTLHTVLKLTGREG